MITVNILKTRATYLYQTLPAGAADDGIIEHEAPDVEADMEGDLECGEHIDHELHHLPKRANCYACSQARMKMKPARRRDPALKERPAAWGHTLLGDHISAADSDLERTDLKLGITLLDAGALGDMIVVSSKNVNDTWRSANSTARAPSITSTRTTRRSSRPQRSRNPWCTSLQLCIDQSPTASWRGSTSSSSMELDAFYFRTSERAARALLALRTRAGPSSWPATSA